MRLQLHDATAQKQLLIIKQKLLISNEKAAINLCFCDRQIWYIFHIWYIFRLDLVQYIRCKKSWQHCCIHCVPEMITIRFAGWISGRIVSLQPDTDIQKLLSNGNRIWNRVSDTVLSMFRGFRLLEKVAHCTIIVAMTMAQSFIHYLQKHLFSLLCHDSESVCGILSVP